MAHRVPDQFKSITKLLETEIAKNAYEDGLSNPIKELSSLATDVLKGLRLFTVPFILAANYYQISLQMPPPIIESNATTSDIPYPVDPFQLETEFATAGNHVWVSWPPLPDDTGFLASVSSGGESPSSSAVLRRPRCLDCSASAAA
jgi:hypothetical protein